MKISVHVMSNGDISVRWPRGVMPDRDTLERVADMIRMYRKEAVA